MTTTPNTLAINTVRAEAMRVTEESLARIKSHPFVLAANAQNLSLDQAQRWIMCAGRESRSFPEILANMVERSSNERIRQLLRSNLDDEHGNGDPENAHFMHYLQLLDALGIPRERFSAYDEQAGIKLALRLAYNVSTQPSEGIAIGYMLVNEGMTSITYAAAYNALRRYYPAVNTPFFTLHVEVDARHVAELLTAVEMLPVSQLGDLLFGINLGERGMAVLLDEALGVFDFSPAPAMLTRGISVN